jgi:hypothetical protein
VFPFSPPFALTTYEVTRTPRHLYIGCTSYCPPPPVSNQ